MIYFYVEGKSSKEILYLCKRLGVHLITVSEKTHELSLAEGVVSTLINNRPKLFKKQVQLLDPKLVLLQNDSTSPRGQWIARNYKSYLITELTVNTRKRYIARKKAGFIGSWFVGLVHRLSGLTGIQPHRHT